MAIQRDVGAVTSYAEAKAGGYTGTRAEWRALLANLPNEPMIVVGSASWNGSTFSGLTITSGQTIDEIWSYLSGNNLVFLFIKMKASDKVNTAFVPVLVPNQDTSVAVFTAVDATGNHSLIITSAQSSPSSPVTHSWAYQETPVGANAISYDNTASGLEAADVQDAIDELVDRMNDGLMIVTATATWQAGTGELTSFTITSGQTDGDVCLAALTGTPMVLIVDSATYVLASTTSSPLGSAEVDFTLTYAGAVRKFSLKRSRNIPYTYTWAHTKTLVQTTSNLVTSLSSSSTDTQYPSAKCVYDLIADINARLGAIEQH